MDRFVLPAATGVEALSAIDRAAAAWLEGDFSGFTAGCADGLITLAGAARRFCCAAGGETVTCVRCLVLGPGSGVTDRFVVADKGRVALSAPFRSARLASHRLLDAALGVKALFSDGKPERSVTIDADKIKILQQNLTAAMRHLKSDRINQSLVWFMRF